MHITLSVPGLEQGEPTEFYVYLGCLGVGLLFTVLSAFFGHLIGGGHDVHVDVGTGGHAEAGFDHSGMPGLSPFSPTTICSFITAFGGFGLIFTRIEATRSVWINAPLAILGGLIVAAGVFWVFGTVFRHTQSSSEGRTGDLVGRTATVISPIPLSGVGEIAYVQGGSRYTAPAREERGKSVATGQTVKIVRIADSQFFVSAI
jgi:membrane protein implicated in regulation of membrane protease activity